jgi:hypothetical protein
MLVFSTGVVFGWHNGNQADADNRQDGEAGDPFGHYNIRS